MTQHITPIISNRPDRLQIFRSHTSTVRLAAVSVYLQSVRYNERIAPYWHAWPARL